MTGEPVPNMSSPTISPDAVSPIERASAIRAIVMTILAVTIGSVVLGGGQLVLAGISEGYCVVWPSIGTRFASEFSERGFTRVQRGMSREQVRTLLGYPLSISSVRPAPSGMPEWQRGDETWQYSQDSSAMGGDWAWLSREIVFRHGAVVQTVRWIYHD